MAHVIGQGLARAVFPYEFALGSFVVESSSRSPEGDEYDDDVFPQLGNFFGHISHERCSAQTERVVSRVLSSRRLYIYPL